MAITLCAAVSSILHSLWFVASSRLKPVVSVANRHRVVVPRERRGARVFSITSVRTRDAASSVLWSPWRRLGMAQDSHSHRLLRNLYQPTVDIMTAPATIMADSSGDFCDKWGYVVILIWDYRGIIGIDTLHMVSRVTDIHIYLFIYISAVRYLSLPTHIQH